MEFIARVAQAILSWNGPLELLGGSVAVLLLLAVGFVSAAWLQKRKQLPRVAPKDPNMIAVSDLPFPTWVASIDGPVLAASRDLPMPARGVDRVIFSDLGVDSHFRIVSSETETERQVIAVPCDDLVALENTNKRLMGTLSKTFAKLPIGLVIFDADKTLTHFNPAVTTLLKLEPTWLALRPTISSLLEKLRENQHLPDHKDFLEWRRLLVDMNAATEHNNYSDVWTLPNGRSIKVSGEAHSEGATTFLFEDISAQIAVERQHLAETALNQAVIDLVRDPMVVIGAAGKILFSNTAFEELFSYEAENVFADTSLAKLAADFPTADAFWADLRNFVSKTIDRQSWKSVINLDAERVADVHPMPDGSTLVFFRLKWVSPRQKHDKPTSALPSRSINIA